MVEGGRDWVLGALDVSTRGLSSSAAAVEDAGRCVDGGAAEDEARREAMGMGRVSKSKDQPGSKKLEGSSPCFGVDARPATNIRERRY